MSRLAFSTHTRPSTRFYNRASNLGSAIRRRVQSTGRRQAVQDGWSGTGWRSELTLRNVGNLVKFRCMGLSDPAGEMLRLAELYRQMSDGELLKLARDKSELVEVAQQSLALEMSQRQLKAEPLELPSPRPPDDPESPFAENRELVEFTTVWCVEDALRVQYALDVAGIPFFMGEEKATGVDLVTSNFADGVVVRVMRIGYSWASAALQGYEPRYVPESEKENRKQESEAPNVRVCCPRCKSQEVILEDTVHDKPAAEVASQFEWTCVACGNKWRDDGIAACAIKKKIDFSEP